MSYRATLALLCAMLAVAAAPNAPAQAAALPPIHHVYIIVLENENASTTFAADSPAPYLSKTLRAQGAYVPNYYGIGHVSLDNYVAMISGQAPNLSTQTDCQFYTDFLAAGTAAFGQAAGTGCVYPSSVPTLVNQLNAAGLAWRDYNDGMGADPLRESSVCGHPALNGRDGTQSATAQDQYATRHDPFMYFHAIIDNNAVCDTHVVNLEPLPHDLAAFDAPNYAFITPNLCNDGHDSPCPTGAPGGLAQADTFLRQWVPRITGSRAFRHDGGLLIVTFDEASTSDTRACCGEIPGPGTPRPGLGGPGGGDVGAVLLSPYINPGTVSQQPYNHYTMLRSIEDLFRLPRIGYAQLPGSRSLGSDVFACAPQSPPIAAAGKLPAGSEFDSARIARQGNRAQLIVHSVGNAALRIVARHKGMPATVTRRSLEPCRSYSIGLPNGRGWSASVSAYGGGGSQSVTLTY